MSIDWVIDWALVLKALHIIAIISWMAGLLYLPRLYVYHASAKTGSELSERLKVMEYKLLRIIMNPAMIASWLFGLLTAYLQGQFDEGWFHVKMVFVILLTISHMVMAKHRKDFASDNNQKSERYFRIFNEVPTILMIIIVFLVILKPI